MVGPPCNSQGLISSESPQFMRSFDGSYDVGFIAKNDWTCHLWKRTVAGGAMSTLFPFASIAGNPLNDPLFANDTHYTFAVALDKQDRVWVAGNHHNEPTRLSYASVKTWPPSTTWTSVPYAGSPWASTGLDKFSYFNFTRRLNGDLIFFCAQETDNTGQGGRQIIAHRLPAGSSTWVPLMGDGRLVINGVATPADQPDRAYTIGVYNELRPDGIERLWWVGMWAKIGTGGELTHGFERQQPMAMYTDSVNPAVWRTVTGQTVTIPKQWLDADRLTNNLTCTGIPNYNKNAGGMCIDSSGFPHFVVQNGTNFDNSIVPYWIRCWWDGAAWQNAGLPSAAHGTSIAPMLVALRDKVWYSTSTGVRMRLREVNAGTMAYMGFNLGGGERPWFEPAGATNRGRISYLLPDGDTPLVFDFGVYGNPVPG